MPHTNQLCIHLFSDLFPCPWLKHIPQLKYAKERLQADIDAIGLPLPEYLQETMELCQEYKNYDPAPSLTIAHPTDMIVGHTVVFIV